MLERIVSTTLIKTGLPDTAIAELTAWITRSEELVQPVVLSDQQWDTLDKLKDDYSQLLREAIADEDIDVLVGHVLRQPEAGFRSFLQKRLDERSFDVLGRRYGVDRSRRQTLEEAAEGYGVTRERIRQLEAKALRRCRVAAYSRICRTFLDSQREEILDAVSGGSLVVLSDTSSSLQKPLTGLQRIAIEIQYGTFENWMDAHLNLVRRQGKRVGWIVPNADPAKQRQLTQWLRENPAGAGSLRSRIGEALYRARWPVSTVYLQDNLPDVAESRLVDFLRDEMDAEFKGELVISMRRLPASLRLILVLRDAGRSLHVSEIRSRHNEMFGFDIEEHAAGAVLQRLEEALIVGVGTYDLYENLQLSEDLIKNIRDLSVLCLTEKGHFLSAKLLRRHLSAELPPEVISYLTARMLLGICQDDPRFATRRGLMIGLAKEGFEETFTSLTETVHQIVADHGPVSVADVRKHMSHEREVLDVSINMVLQGSPEIVMPARGLYDSIERVVGDEREIDRLTNAIQIALVDRPISLPILSSRLAVVGFSISSVTVLSFLRSADFVSRTGNTFRLSDPSPGVLSYNQIFHEVYKFTRSNELNYQAVTQAISDCDLRRFAPLDFRLATTPEAWNSVQLSTNENTDLLDELMSEFEF